MGYTVAMWACGELEEVGYLATMQAKQSCQEAVCVKWNIFRGTGTNLLCSDIWAPQLWPCSAVWNVGPECMQLVSQAIPLLACDTLPAALLSVTYWVQRSISRLTCIEAVGEGRAYSSFHSCFSVLGRGRDALVFLGHHCILHLLLPSHLMQNGNTDPDFCSSNNLRQGW